MQHIDFETLAPDVRQAVENQTGTIRASSTASAGLNSEIAAFLETETGPVFLKALPAGHAGAVRQQREALINPHVQPLSPRLLWHETAAGWNMLAFEIVQGARHANYAPDPGRDELFDLPKLVTAMEILAQIPCPDLPGIKNAQQRWAGYLDEPDDAKHFAGDTLLHTDYNPLNILITDAKAWIVDWAWPTKGAAFIDPACLVLRLIASGQDPDLAEQWAAQTSAWQEADPAAVDLFAAVNVRLWREIADQDDAAWKREMARAADSWARYRFSGV